MARHILINYDLKGPAKNYRGLTQALGELPVHAVKKVMESCWVILTEETPAQVYDHLRPFVDEDDTMIVVSLGRQLAREGGLPSDVKNWLDARFDTSS